MFLTAAAGSSIIAYADGSRRPRDLLLPITCLAGRPLPGGIDETRHAPVGKNQNTPTKSDGALVRSVAISPGPPRRAGFRTETPEKLRALCVAGFETRRTQGKPIYLTAGRMSEPLETGKSRCTSSAGSWVIRHSSQSKNLENATANREC